MENEEYLQNSDFQENSQEIQKSQNDEVDTNEIDAMISQKEEELNQINALRISTLEKIITDKTKLISQLQDRVQEYI